MWKHEGIQNDAITSSLGFGASFVIRHSDFVINGAGFLISLAAFATTPQRIKLPRALDD